MKRFLKILRYTIASILLLLLLAVVLVNLTPVQNYLVGKASGILTQKLKTKVKVDHVRIDFLNHLLIQGIYVEDKAQDTLLYLGEAQIRITDWFIFKDKPTLHYLGLQNAYIHLYRKGWVNVWNYDFIADAFASNSPADTAQSGNQFELDLEKVYLEHVRFHMDDIWGGIDQHYEAGKLTLNAKDIDFKKKLITLNDIYVTESLVDLNLYHASHPPRPKSAIPDTFDTTPFNPGNWRVVLAKLAVDKTTFKLTMDDKTPVPGLFDENHLIIKNINIQANTLSIVGDTIHGSLTHLYAAERCGIVIKDMQSKITVSPIASICDSLYLETGYSKINNYYAMHYKRFPDFPEYIDSVTMVGRLKDALVDIRDIEYFAPELKIFPNTLLHVTGEGKGTVADFSGHNIVVTDGISTVKGSMSMKGLPDIFKTYITFTDGTITTNSKGILRYAPFLANSPDVAIDSISFATFNGSYNGFLDDFAVKGTLNSNLGWVNTDIAMKIPGFVGVDAVYSGAVQTKNLQIGLFLKQPMFGGITLDEKIVGRSFNADNAQLKIDGFIKEFVVNGYPYHNIITHDTLAKKQMVGTILIDDPNLGMEFDGSIDYTGKDLVVKAKANLLGSNFKALHLTKDDLTASGDFDLNCTGSSIDNFNGYAKLYNIDLLRNSHRMAIDSIRVTSSGSGDRKMLNIQSNDLAANINGDFKLSLLPVSIQYYLSKYIPNYISPPEKVAPAQNFEFKVVTKSIDSIFAAALPIVRGFDSSEVSGSLNTIVNKLKLNIKAPYGSIGQFHMRDINVTGDGNLDAVALNATVANVAIGDSFINSSVGLTTILSNDSVAFTIATTTPDTSTTITLNGHIKARKDSLFLTILPSRFYLNKVKWDIAGGSQIFYSDNYLLVRNLALTSGLQRIAAGTELQSNEKSLLISTENLDLGQLGSWAGLGAYQADGRLNGTVRVDKIFKDLLVTANMKATGVKLGADTIGTINLIGDYNGAKKLLSLDPQTGIYRNNASIVASGKISLDSATKQKLDGSIKFNDAPAVWASSFLVGILSHLTGTLNGSIGFDGTSYNPILDGKVVLKNGGLKVDYMGCFYTIPSATIHIDNRIISFGRVQAFDVHKNTATISGYFSHNLFKDMRMRLKVQTDKLEVLNLTAADNNLFYGNVIASMDSFTIRGPFNNIKLRAYNAAPAGKSKIYIPLSSAGEIGAYSYVSFKTYGKNIPKLVNQNKDKIYINIDANLNTLAEMHIVLDPSTGDEIMARGDGNIQMDIPPDNDIRMTGIYAIDNGVYTLTFNQLFINRQFKLNQGSTISFNGPFSETSLNVDAVYSAKARLLDLLTDADKTYLTSSEQTDAQTPQWINVMLHMNGLLRAPKLTFDLDLEDKHSQSTFAYKKLMLLNNDDRQKFDQVASLLLISSFIPPEGIGTSAVAIGAINNISQIISGTASSGLTNIVNKLTGDKQLNVAVKYTNYNYNDQGLGGINRNQFKLGVNRSYFNDRLVVEVGSTSDWGKPASSTNTSGFNITGDFRIQYLLSQNSGLRLNCFRTSDYDVTLDKDIQRSGVGISWRKSFDNVTDFFRSNDYKMKEKQKQDEKMREAEIDTTAKPDAAK